MFTYKRIYFLITLALLSISSISARQTAIKKQPLRTKKITKISPQQTNFEKQSSAIIFDLTNVLFKENQIGFAQKIGYGTLAGYTLTHWRNPGHCCLDMLNKISTDAAQKPDTCITLKGRTMPRCIVELQEGKKDCLQTKTEIALAIQDLDKTGYFSSVKEKSLMLSIMNLILDPQAIAAITEPVKPVVALIQKLKTAGHQVYLGGNGPEELCIALQKEHPAIMNLFDGRVMSFQVKKVKPHENVFQNLLATYQLDPKKCFLIDDLESSVATGKKLGIEGMVYDKISTVTQKLKNFGVVV